MEKKPDQKRRAFWLKHLHQWHWISSALCLIGMLLFAATGIALNHASDIGASPKITKIQIQLPKEILVQLNGKHPSGKAPFPQFLADWVEKQLSVHAAGRDAEWSAEEAYLSLPRPGGDAWMSINLESGEVQYESTDRGWLSYFNDLHKGRHTGLAWSWFIDIFAVACVVFCITGLFLLQLHSGNRPTTWPMVGLGLVIPLLLAILYIH